MNMARGLVWVITPTLAFLLFAIGVIPLAAYAALMLVYAVSVAAVVLYHELIIRRIVRENRQTVTRKRSRINPWRTK